MCVHARVVLLHVYQSGKDGLSVAELFEEVMHAYTKLPKLPVAVTAAPPVPPAKGAGAGGGDSNGDSNSDSKSGGQSETDEATHYAASWCVACGASMSASECG